MKIYLALCTVCISIISYGQENIDKTTINLEEMNAALEAQMEMYVFKWELLPPSLSYIKEKSPTNFHLMEIDFTVDLRRQAYQDKTPLLMVPKNKFVISEFNINRPTTPKSSVTITGRRRLDYSIHRGDVRNTVYKDASFYTGAYNPFTGLPYL